MADNIAIFNFLFEGGTARSEPEFARMIQTAIDNDSKWVRIGSNSMLNLNKVIHIERIDMEDTKVLPMAE